MTSTVHPSLPDRFDRTDLYDLLSAPARRSLLVRLARRSGGVELDAAAREVARETDGCSTDDEDGSAAMRARLHHVHVPKLTRAGLVAVGPNRERLEATDGGERVARAADRFP